MYVGIVQNNIKKSNEIQGDHKQKQYLSLADDVDDVRSYLYTAHHRYTNRFEPKINHIIATAISVFI